jgi:hypothetical protein
MPWYRVGETVAHIRFGKRKGGVPKQCQVPFKWEHGEHCCQMATILCDFDIGGAEGETCDMPLCQDHATEVGPDRHYCPKHATSGENK